MHGRTDTTHPCGEPGWVPWGIAGLDGPGRGLVGRAFNMVAMPDHEAAYALVAHFLGEGLYEEGRVALVSLENPALILGELGRYGFDFESALQREQLVYLYYKPAFLHSLSLATDYVAVFAEIRRLAGAIQRLALLSAELVFNLQSEHLAVASVSSAVAASGQAGFTVLGSCVQQSTDGHQLLHASCSNLMPLYVTGTRLPHTGRRYRLEVQKAAGATQGAVVLNLDSGHEHTRVTGYAEIA